MAVSVETLEHEEDCRCGLCRGRGLSKVAASPNLSPSESFVASRCQFAKAEKAIAGLERQEAAVREQMVLA